MAAPGGFSGTDFKLEEGVFLGFTKAQLAAFIVMVAFIAISPFFLYPVFLMKLLCFALFACAFNLLIGYVGLLSFGHAAYFGMGGYLAGHAAKVWGLAARGLDPDRRRGGRGARPRSSAGSPFAGRASTSP